MYESPPELIFDQLKKIRKIGLEGKEIVVNSYLGKESFGVVFSGEMEGHPIAIKVAIRIVGGGRPVYSVIYVLI